MKIRDILQRNVSKYIMKLNGLIGRHCTPKSVSLIMTVIYIGSLIPLFLIARYNYPSADDYSIGETCRHVWMETHNIFGVIWQAVLMAAEDYMHWMGYFSSIFLMSLHPGVFGEQWYFLTPVIMTGVLSFSVAGLFRAIMVKWLKIDRYFCRCITIPVLYVMIHGMVGRVEALYWFCGAVNYVFLHSAGLFMLGGLISAACAKERKKRTRAIILASIMGVLAGGGNYMTSLICAVLLITAAGMIIYQQTWKRHRQLLIPMGFYFLAFLASILAPGNQVRAAGATGMHPLKAIMVSIYYAFELALSDWTNWIVILMVIILIPLFWKAASQTSFAFRCPLLVVLFSFGLLAATVTPPLFAVGNIIAGRLQALMFIMYMVLLPLNVGYVTGWLRKNMSFQTRTNHCTPLFLACCMIIFLSGTALSVIADPHCFTWSSAVTDLSNGSARAYGDALQERSDILNAAESDADLLFPPLPVRPQLLYFDDITVHNTDWQNRAVARYYGVHSVALMESRP